MKTMYRNKELRHENEMLESDMPCKDTEGLIHLILLYGQFEFGFCHIAKRPNEPTLMVTEHFHTAT